MLTNADIVTLTIPIEDMEKVVCHAKKACVGGVSRLRSGKERSNNLYEDQLVGQFCNYVGNLYLTGSAIGWDKSRQAANANPTKGDDGRDIWSFFEEINHIALLPIDIKGSKMRSSTNPLDYRLPVRPSERHPKFIYVLALVPVIDVPVQVHLVGWIKEEDLPEHEDVKGVFQGAYTIWADELSPMATLKDKMTSYLLSKAQRREE